MQLKKKHRKIATIKTRKRCWYCGDLLRRSTASIDHVVPLSRGGSEEKSNKVLACKACNTRKDDMDLETYRWFLQDKKALGERVIFFGERAEQQTTF